MKKKDIQIGAFYTNGKGRIRRVIDFGPYHLYPGQEDMDCLEYEVVEDGRKKGSSKGNKGRMTKASFAVWAKAVVAEEADHGTD